MVDVGYLLRIDAKRFGKLNQKLAAKMMSSAGEPLVPTSSTRALISIDTLKALRSTMSSVQINQTLRKFGADWERPVDEQTASALLQTRDPNDLPEREVLEQSPVKDPQTGEFLDWHLIECNLNGAWALFGGRDNINWGNVWVGHIDTGFTEHPVLGFNNSAGTVSWVDTERDRNFFTKEVGNIGEDSTMAAMFASWNDATDTLGGFSGGHGTRTSSLLCGYDKGSLAKLAAVAGKTYAGFFGAAPRVPVVPIRLEDSIWIQAELGRGLPEALNYLVQSAGVSVISLSMGSPKTTFTGTDVPKQLKDALRNAYTQGVIVVCAAGNHVPDEQVVFPARLAHTIAVGGSAPKGVPWNGSSYGVQVDISAPAYPIRRATTERGGKYTYGVGDGTSFATPLVAGTAALWLAYHKAKIAAKYPARWQRVAAYESLLKATARVPTGWPTAIRGSGILDAGALLQAELPSVNTLVEQM